MLPCCRAKNMWCSNFIFSDGLTHVSHVAAEPCFACCTVIMIQHVAMLPCCRAKNKWCSNLNFSDVQIHVSHVVDKPCFPCCNLTATWGNMVNMAYLQYAKHEFSHHFKQ